MVDKRIRSLILQLCKEYDRKKNFPYVRHIRTTLSNAKYLAKLLNADMEVVETAAWLHDIKKLMMDDDKDKHHITGSVEAARILKGFGYDEVFVDKVRRCILTHSNKDEHVPQTIEEKIVASADALSHFDIFDLLVAGKIIKKNMSQKEAKVALLKKYEKSWNKMMPQARKLAEDRYKAFKILLG